MADLSTPPGPSLSKFSPKLIFDDEGADIEWVLSRSPTTEGLNASPRSRGTLRGSSRNTSHTRSFDDEEPFEDQVQEVNVPFLSSSNMILQPLLLPLRRHTGAERENVVIVDHDHSISSPRPSPRLPSDAAQCTSPSSCTKFLDRAPETASPSSDSRIPKTRRRHPFAKGYEVPQWRLLIIHLGLCALAYPILLVFVIPSRGTTLFWARLCVGVGCGLVGALLGMNLMNLARAILEAATWATVIHQSRVPNVPGVRLKDLAAYSNDPFGSLGALRLLWDRHSYEDAHRGYRKFYDKRPWSLWILFFLLNLLISSVLPFLLGRIVNIDVGVIHQYQDYYEVAVAADISSDDITRAAGLQRAFNNYLLTWTLAPFSTHGGLPAAVSFISNNESVYFSEVVLSQLVTGGSGFGTFASDTTSPSINTNEQDLLEANPSVGVDRGSLLRFPRWGIRINCVKVPDIPENVITVSENNFTYLFTPRETIRALFQGYNLSLPPDYEQPFNFSNTLSQGDHLPEGLNTSSIAMGAQFSNNGVAHSMKSTPSDLGSDFDRFVTVEHILVRLNNTFAHNGTFGVTGSSIPDVNGVNTSIGYDAAVCLELYEPWVLEVYNSTVSSPISMRIVAKAAFITDMNTQVIKEKLMGSKITDPLVKRYLNSTNLQDVYIAGHQNSVNQIVKDNGRDSYYVPSPTLISFTGGDGPCGYTELSEVYYAKARALADAGNVLPYFAGSGLSVARQYPDRLTTNTTIANIQLAVVIFAVCLMGLISALFVPRLPRDIPRRGFDLYSWFSAFYAQELVAERTGGVTKNMDLQDIKDYTGELKFHYLTS